MSYPVRYRIVTVDERETRRARETHARRYVERAREPLPERDAETIVRFTRQGDSIEARREAHISIWVPAWRVRRPASARRERGFAKVLMGFS
jgi:hypothetical protein